MDVKRKFIIWPLVSPSETFETELGLINVVENICAVVIKRECVNDSLQVIREWMWRQGKIYLWKNERARVLFQVLLLSLAVAIKCDKREESCRMAAVWSPLQHLLFILQAFCQCRCSFRSKSLYTWELEIWFWLLVPILF